MRDSWRILGYKQAFSLIFMFACLFSFSYTAFKVESRTSLPLLFKFRNWVDKPLVPDKLLVVSPFAQRVRHLPRERHAQIIDKLVSLGVQLIVVDIFFEVNSNEDEQDLKLAESIHKSPGIVLVQKSEKLKVPVAQADHERKVEDGVQNESETVGEDTDEARVEWIELGYRLRNSVAPYFDSPTLMAPPLVPADESRVDRVPLLHLVLHDSQQHVCFAGPATEKSIDNENLAEEQALVPQYVPTLTMAVLEQRLLNSMRSSESHAAWLESNVDDLASERLSCNLMESLRVQFRNNGLRSFPGFSDPEIQAYFETWTSILARQNSREPGDMSVETLQLNYLGPPRSIRTITYDDVDKMHGNRKENSIRGAVVFLGGSFREAELQKEDGHLTAFTGGSRLMSGVEIKATAYQNLVSGTSIKVMNEWVTILLMTPCALLIWISATRMSMPWFSMTIGLTGFSVVALTCYAFVAQGVWLSVSMILFSSILLIVLSVIWRFRGSSRDRDKAIQHLRSFVSDAVVGQLDSGRNHVVEDAVCLVTDIRNFTAIGGKMEPGTLHMSNDAYFTHLFDCVAREGADVVKTYGDSMTAVWLSAGGPTIDCAVRAGFRILGSETDEKTTGEAGCMVTNIGLHRGRLAVGFVGALQQKTVEITGSTVYIASRLEQLNKKLGTSFLTTYGVAREISVAPTRSMGKSHLKGYEEPVDIVEIYRSAKNGVTDEKRMYREGSEVNACGNGRETDNRLPA